MTYEQAITQVKNGQRVKRTGWNNHYLEKAAGDDLKVETVFIRTTKAPYTATQDDIVSDDWTTA